MNTIVTDGNFDIASAVGPVLFTPPIPGVNVKYLLEQQFLQNQATFVELALNTAHPDYPSYVLVEETALQMAGNGCVTWTRRYAQTPSQHFEFETFAYNFIGFSGVVSNVGADPGAHTVFTGRLRFTQVVPVKITYDYFKSDGTIASLLGGLPVTQAQLYYIDATARTTTFVTTDYLWDAPPYDTASSPSRAAYVGLMASDLATPTSFSIAVEASKISRWMGNIWRRENRSVKAL